MIAGISAITPIATVGEIRDGIQFTAETLMQMADSIWDGHTLETTISGKARSKSGIPPNNLQYNVQTRQLCLVCLLYGDKISDTPDTIISMKQAEDGKDPRISVTNNDRGSCNG